MNELGTSGTGVHQNKVTHDEDRKVTEKSVKVLISVELISVIQTGPANQRSRAYRGYVNAKSCAHSGHSQCRPCPDCVPTLSFPSYRLVREAG